MDEPLFYGVDEAFSLLRIGRTRGYQEIKAGRLLLVKNGGKSLIPASSARDYAALLIREAQEKRAARKVAA